MIELKIPTAQEFVSTQEHQKTIWVNEAIKSICKQIESVFDYIKNASNGEHHMKVYKEVIISLDTGINDVGMQQVKEKLKLMGFKISMYDIDNWERIVENNVNENRVYEYNIFSTMDIGNGGQSFDKRHYKELNGFPRKVKSVMILSTR